MPKRSCPFNDSIQALKKQIGHEAKTREIRSTESEKALQLLYKGASKQFEPKEEARQISATYFECFQCSAPLAAKTKCFYCDKFICSTCTNICTRCDEEYCKNCSFTLYDQCAYICYSCY